MSTEPDPSTRVEEEIELLRLIGSGDRGAFGQLYDRFCGVIFSTAYRVLNNRETAVEVVQDVFMQIWEKAALYDPTRGRPLTWAVVLTRNKSIDRLRSIQRREHAREAFEKESDTKGLDTRDSADALSAAETGATMRKAMQQLPPDQIEVLDLAFFEGMTHSEIAGKLNQPLGTVKARIRRAMMRLREIVPPQL